MTDDHTREALDEIRRRRLEKAKAKARHKLDQEHSALRDFVSNKIVACGLMLMLSHPERHKATCTLPDGTTEPVPDDTLGLVFQMARMALVDAKFAADEQENPDA